MFDVFAYQHRDSSRVIGLTILLDDPRLFVGLANGNSPLDCLTLCGTDVQHRHPSSALPLCKVKSTPRSPPLALIQTKIHLGLDQCINKDRVHVCMNNGNASVYESADSLIMLLIRE
ncbi:MAG TPA: hypothetical protein DDW73_08580 [Rhizobium sp.]|nr:hypothetical protein [Rhizobium sp.]